MFGASLFIVAASFNGSKQCLRLYMYSLFEKHDGGWAGALWTRDFLTGQNRTYWNTNMATDVDVIWKLLFSFQKNWNYDLLCLTSAQGLLTATHMNWPHEIYAYISFDIVVCFLILLIIKLLTVINNYSLKSRWIVAEYS